MLVETNDVARSRLEAVVAWIAQVESHHCFATARARICRAPFDLLLTNVRLGAYNGLHLVSLGSSGHCVPCSIVYSDEPNPGLAREVQRAGAFYELSIRLPVTLPGYVFGTLPDHDRRDPVLSDRRKRFRGGRRGWDIHHAKWRRHCCRFQLSSM